MQLHRCCREGYRKELCEAYEALVGSPELFDKRDCLNSDGRRLFEKLVAMLVREHPEHRRLAARARRNPCIEEVARLAKLTFYVCDPLEHWYASHHLRHPYHYPPPLPWES